MVFYYVYIGFAVITTNSKAFFSPPKETLYALAVMPCPPHSSQLLGTTDLLSVTMSLSVLDIAC